MPNSAKKQKSTGLFSWCSTQKTGRSPAKKSEIVQERMELRRKGREKSAATSSDSHASSTSPFTQGKSPSKKEARETFYSRKTLSNDTLALAKKALGAEHQVSGWVEAGNVVSLDFYQYDRQAVFALFHRIGKQEQARNIQENGSALSFTVPRGLHLSPTTYIQVVLELAGRIRKLQTEMEHCWKITGEKQLKQAKIRGLNEIMTAITDINADDSLNNIIARVRSQAVYRLDEKRTRSGCAFFACLTKNSRTTDMLDRIDTLLAKEPSVAPSAAR